MTRPRSDHVVVVMAGIDPLEPRAHALCQHCGIRFVMELPVEVSVYVAANKAFVKAHAHCPKRAAVPAPAGRTR